MTREGINETTSNTTFFNFINLQMKETALLYAGQYIEDLNNEHSNKTSYSETSMDHLRL